ncbi:deoxyribonuclease [Echinococcus multilocularis]|uniref:Deoxyribonuclease n=1 Tax=Echinococcus multilocularis TaxID=6211 RepID=A0A0S4MMS6_ECHMU|nr:deoxyribonuclease [Echinococcus multilocularis]
MGLRATSGQTVKSAAFNVQIFGKEKVKKSDVMKILVKIFLRYGGAIIQEIRDKSDEAINALMDAINTASPTDNFTVHGYASMVTKQTEFERSPDCFSLTAKWSGVRMGYLAVHVSPKSVAKELDALYYVTKECESFANTPNLVLLGDMNADCSYITKQARDNLLLRKDKKYEWRIADTMDTTVSDKPCAYDRVITKGSVLAGLIPTANPFNFRAEYKLDLPEAKRVSDHYPVEFDIH